MFLERREQPSCASGSTRCAFAVWDRRTLEMGGQLWVVLAVWSLSGVGQEWGSNGSTSQRWRQQSGCSLALPNFSIIAKHGYLWASRCGQWSRRHLRELIYAQLLFIHSGHINALLFTQHLEYPPPSGIVVHQRVLATKGWEALCRDPSTAQGSTWACDPAAPQPLSPQGLFILRAAFIPRSASACKCTFLVWPQTFTERSSMSSQTVVPISHLFPILSL